MTISGEGTGSVREDVRRVLVYRMGSLGDTVVALPALHLIARAFPNAERKMLTNFPVSEKAPAAKAVLGENGLIHGYFRYVVGTRSVRELAALWWTLLRWHPEVLVYLGPRRGVAAAKRDAQFFRICGIRRQVGVFSNRSDAGVAARRRDWRAGAGVQPALAQHRSARRHGPAFARSLGSEAHRNRTSPGV